MYYEGKERVGLKTFVIKYSNPDIGEDDYANEMMVDGKDKEDAIES